MSIASKPGVTPVPELWEATITVRHGSRCVVVNHTPMLWGMNQYPRMFL